MNTTLDWNEIAIVLLLIGGIAIGGVRRILFIPPGAQRTAALYLSGTVIVLLIVLLIL